MKCLGWSSIKDQKGFKSSGRWVATSALKNTEYSLWQRNELSGSNHLACTEGQLELRMVQSIPGTWSVTAQVHPPASHGCSCTPQISWAFAGEFYSLPWMCSQCNLIFVALLERAVWEGWAGPCGVTGSRTKLFLHFFFCGFTALVTPSKLSGKEPEAN